MTRTIDSPLGLAWVAFCSAVAAAIATGLAIHDPAGTKIAVALLGTAVGLAVALVSFALVSSLRRAPSEAVVASAPARPARQPEAAHEPTWVAREPAVDDLRARLEARLAAGRELRDEPPDARVDEWIETTHRMLESSAPGAARYFSALDRSSWPAQVARLETIVRDFL